MASTQAITNDDIMGVVQDLMQITSDGFVRVENRMDRLENRMNSLESAVDQIKLELQAIKSKLYEHDVRLGDLQRITEELVNNHSAYLSDIGDLLDRVQALENKAPNITPAEVHEMQRLLQLIVNWAIKVAEATSVPLEMTV